ncbi:MAG: hypothetical protein QXK88_01090 [Desulfurococcaceae archaeon]
MYLDTAILDHYYLELDNGCIAVVTGNWHTEYCAVGYIKYCPTSKPTPWSRNGTFYERLVKTYSAKSVREHTGWSIYIPFFDSFVPCIPVHRVVKAWNPIARTLDLTNKVRDELERRALEAVMEISEYTGVLTGITGSLLPGIHNLQMSDIDFVIYGSYNSLKVVEYISDHKDTFKPLNGLSLAKWAEGASQSTGLTVKEVLKFYRNWRRGARNGREYSIIYNDGVRRDALTLPTFRNGKPIKAIVELEGGLDALSYPSYSRVLSWRAPKTASRDAPHDIEGILSYETVYMPALYEGGLFEIDGLLQCCDLTETCRVLLGGAEYRGTMKYCK